MWRLGRPRAGAREDCKHFYRAPRKPSDLLRIARGLWRGPALADLRDQHQIAPLVAPLDRQYSVLGHELLEVELERGRHRSVLAELAAAVEAEPHDERLASMLVVAHYRSGQQGQALAAYRTAAERLRTDLGIEPGTELRSLEQAVLRQDPALDLTDARTDLRLTRQREDRGTRGARLVLPNGVELELAARTWIIGRHPGCDVPLADPEVSRRHAEIRPVRGGYLLLDLASTNGTRIGGREVREHTLADGDTLTVGETELHFLQRENGPDPTAQ